jgi:tetratricopeptide (TPR) repeat protein
LAVRPDFPELHLSYANALHELGRIDEAISIYHRALELRPDWPEPLSNLGLALPLRSRFDEAIARDGRNMNGDIARPLFPMAIGLTPDRIGTARI